jgi:hypothetical protein
VKMYGIFQIAAAISLFGRCWRRINSNVNMADTSLKSSYAMSCLRSYNIVCLEHFIGPCFLCDLHSRDIKAWHFMGYELLKCSK